MWAAIETLIPSVGLLWLFYLIMKHIVEGDRRERIAQAQWEREHDRPDASPNFAAPEVPRDYVDEPPVTPQTPEVKKPE